MNITLKDLQNFRKEEDRKNKQKEKKNIASFLKLIDENDIQSIKEFKTDLFVTFSDNTKLEFIKKSIEKKEIFEYLILDFCDSSIYHDILNLCLKNNKINGIDTLYEVHKKVRTERGFYEMVMSEAAYLNNLEIVKHCIDKEPNIKITNAIKTAIEYHRFEIFKYLIDLDLIDVSKSKLLESAFDKLNHKDYRFILEIVKKDKKIDEDIKNVFFYYSPKSLIKFNRYVKELEPYIMDDINFKSSLFLEYTKREQKNQIIDMLKNGINPNIKGFNHTETTPIEIAIEKNNLKIIKELIDYGARINNWEDIQRNTTQEVIDFIEDYPRFSKLNKELQKLKKVKNKEYKVKMKI